MTARGLRNNNPLNIRHSASRWRGMREEQTDKCFVQFENMALGLRAAFCLLRSYSRRGLETPAEIVARWAPSTENNTEGYIRTVCRLTGYDRHQRLSVADWPRLVWAMARVECGEEVPMEQVMRGFELFNTPKQ